jgi:hypothetical protein
VFDTSELPRLWRLGCLVRVAAEQVGQAGECGSGVLIVSSTILTHYAWKRHVCFTARKPATTRQPECLQRRRHETFRRCPSTFATTPKAPTCCALSTQAACFRARSTTRCAAFAVAGPEPASAAVSAGGGRRRCGGARGTGTRCTSSRRTAARARALALRAALSRVAHECELYSSLDVMRGRHTQLGILSSWQYTLAENGGS